MSIKGVLREELANSLRMEANYVRELAGLPRGSLVCRLIKGRAYYYLVYRDRGRFRAEYRGKVGKAEVDKYRKNKVLRAKYRGLLSRVRKQIRFLRSTLRGKQAV